MSSCPRSRCRPPARHFSDSDVTLDLKEDRWIRAVEIRPGNREVAHHAVLFAGGTGSYGDQRGQRAGVWAVGTPPTAYPDGMGRWLRKGQVITANLHYHPNGTATTDRTNRVLLRQGRAQEGSDDRRGRQRHIRDSPHASRHELRGVYVADQDITVVSFFPHMHFAART